MSTGDICYDEFEFQLQPVTFNFCIPIINDSEYKYVYLLTKNELNIKHTCFEACSVGQHRTTWLNVGAIGNCNKTKNKNGDLWRKRVNEGYWTNVPIVGSSSKQNLSF